MNKITRIFLIVSLFTILAIIPISLGDETIYFGTIIELYYVIVSFITIKFKYSKKEKKLGFLILMYVTTALIDLIFIKNGSIIYTINKIAPLIFMFVMIGYNNFRHEIDIKKITKWIQILMNTIIVISFIMFLLGYSSIKLENGGIQFVTNNFYRSTYGETRMSWIFTHKSRFAIFCFLNIGFLLNNRYIKPMFKRNMVFLSLLDIYFSSSKTILGISIVVLGLNYLNNNFQSKREKLLKFSISMFLIIFIASAIPKVIKVLSATRDVESLGGRLYIWEAGIRKSIQNFCGIGQFDSSNWLTTEKLPGGVYTHAHNMFINESIERGIIPGIFFSLIFIYMIFLFKNKVNRNILIGCIVSSFMDNTLTSEISYIFWFIMLINYLNEKDTEFNNISR